MNLVAGCSESIRSVIGADLTSSTIADTRCSRIELLKRSCSGRIDWHFKQPSFSLVWYRRGILRFKGTFDDDAVTSGISRAANLIVVPPNVEVRASLDTTDACDYAIVFLDGPFAERHLGARVCRPAVVAGQGELMRGLEILCREAASPDPVFDLMFEGWALQALAYIVRASSTSQLRALRRGGLSSRSLRLVEEYIREHLGDPISIASLAEATGLSSRHFLRAFQESMGSSPHQYLLKHRVSEAKRRLEETGDSVTEIGLACGFSHAQHFSASFRKITGVSPSDFRRSSVT